MNPGLSRLLFDAGLGTILDKRAYHGEQRHQSWRVVTSSGVYWVKEERHTSPVAGVETEARVMAALGHRTCTPVAFWPATPRHGAILITAEIPGRSLKAGDVTPSTIRRLCAYLRSVDEERQSFRSYGREGTSPFSSDANPWEIADQYPQHRWHRLLRRLAPEPSTTPVAIHGSFDLDNVILRPDASFAAVDFEAARLGPPEYDLATLLSSVLLAGEGTSHLLSPLASQNLRPRTIAGFVVARMMMRESAGASVSKAWSKVHRLVETAAEA